jgi:hypothetical protein
LSRQAASLAQLNEQSPTQVTSHVEPSLHEMLPLAPNVIAQVAPWPHSTLQDLPQLPWHVAWAAQSNVQLSPHT